MSNRDDNEPEPMEVVRVDTSTLAAISSAEIDQQIATAHKFPRSIKKFLEEVEQMACLNAEMAEECFYSLPRRDTDGTMRNIEGPSARFAEIVASAWGHVRAGARIIAEEQDFVVAQGACHDLQRNVAISFEVRRRITGKSGRRYSADMIGVTGNAAASIALRNAVLRVVPKAFWRPAYESARRTAIGDAKTLEQRRGDAVLYFSKMGVREDRIFHALGVKGMADITLEHLATLTGIKTAIKEGDTTVDQAFPAPPGANIAAVETAVGAVSNDPQQQHIARAASLNDYITGNRIKRADVEKTAKDLGVAKMPARLGDLPPETLKALSVKLGMEKDSPPASKEQLQELTETLSFYGPPALHQAIADQCLGRSVKWDSLTADDVTKLIAYVRAEREKERKEGGQS